MRHVVADEGLLGLLERSIFWSYLLLKIYFVICKSRYTYVYVRNKQYVIHIYIYTHMYKYQMKVETRIFWIFFLTDHEWHTVLGPVPTYHQSSLGTLSVYNILDIMSNYVANPLGIPLPSWGHPRRKVGGGRVLTRIKIQLLQVPLFFFIDK